MDKSKVQIVNPIDSEVIARIQSKLDEPPEDHVCINEKGQEVDCQDATIWREEIEPLRDCPCRCHHPYEPGDLNGKEGE